MTDGVQISVIIPVRNGEDTLPGLLRSLEAQTLAQHDFEVVVVDNASVDGTSEVARGHGARVVFEPVANRSRARNRGAAEARSDLYAFTDADCVADSGWLEALLACADRAPLVAGKVRLRTREQPNAIERFEALSRFGQEAWVRGQGWAATANLLVHADAFELTGGFDPSWRHIGEDVDFCLRAREAGYRLDFCEHAEVEHLGERELRPFLGRAFRHGYSVNQAFYRTGLGYRAWTTPLQALIGDRALRRIGHTPDRFEKREWRRMSRLARLDYAARITGSVWAELTRAR